MQARRLLRHSGLVLTTAQIGWLLHQQWQSLSAADRKRFQKLLRKSQGRPSKLTRGERDDLARITKSLEVPRVLRDGLLSAAGRRPRAAAFAAR
jgi:hypothetical protein